MVGYPESLTDPSFCGQILVCTFPIIGNYGVPDINIKDEFGLPKFFESDHIHVSGLIVLDYSHDYSHWNAFRSLSDWLKAEKIPALYGIDTRLLAKELRINGSISGKIEFPNKFVAFKDNSTSNLVEQVSRKTEAVYGKGNPVKIVAYDCGMKYNILRCLLRRGAEVTVVPYNYKLEKVRKKEIKLLALQRI